MSKYTAFSKIIGNEIIDSNRLTLQACLAPFIDRGAVLYDYCISPSRQILTFQLFKMEEIKAANTSSHLFLFIFRTTSFFSLLPVYSETLLCQQTRKTICTLVKSFFYFFDRSFSEGRFFKRE